MGERRNWIWGLVVAGLLGLGGLGLAIAQDGDDDDDDEDSEVEAGSIAISRTADLSGPEQLAEAERVHNEASALSERVLGMLDEARRDGDIVRVTCLDDKLTQINAHLRTMGDRTESLSEAIETGDDARRNHEFTVISVLSQNFAQLERNANECIGAALYATGATRVVTSIAPGTPTGDPSRTPAIPPVDSPAIPPPASR